MSQTIIELENKLSSILQSYHEAGIDIEIIKRGIKAHMAAKAYLRKPRNAPNNEKIAKKKYIVEATRDEHSKYKRILNIENRIKKKRKEEESLCNNFNEREDTERLENSNGTEPEIRNIQQNPNRHSISSEYNTQQHHDDEINTNVNDAPEHQAEQQNTDSNVNHTKDHHDDNNQCHNCKRKKKRYIR